MNVNVLKYIMSSELRVGMRFPSPLFFNDGENMFLAENTVLSARHMDVLKKWNIPYVLMYEGQQTEYPSAADGQAVFEIESVEDI